MSSNTSRVPAPVRLAPIIRAPDREAKNDTQMRASTKPMKTAGPVVRPTEPMFTVYVNSSKCRHSGDLMNVIRDVHRIPCSVIDVAGGENVPVWLRGTPSLVTGTDVYCGDTAFEFVASISAEPQSQDATTLNDPSVGQPPCFSDILSGKGAKAKNEGIGCGLSQAFAAPVAISEEEAAKKYSGSVDDAMSRLMQSRGRM